LPDTEYVNGTKITYKTSKSHTKKLIADFFAKTSQPRILEEQLSKKTEKSSSNSA